MFTHLWPKSPPHNSEVPIDLWGGVRLTRGLPSNPKDRVYHSPSGKDLFEFNYRLIIRYGVHSSRRGSVHNHNQRKHIYLWIQRPQSNGAYRDRIVASNPVLARADPELTMDEMSAMTSGVGGA